MARSGRSGRSVVKAEEEKVAVLEVVKVLLLISISGLSMAVTVVSSTLSAVCSCSSRVVLVAGDGAEVEPSRSSVIAASVLSVSKLSVLTISGISGSIDFSDVSSTLDSSVVSVDSSRDSLVLLEIVDVESCAVELSMNSCVVVLLRTTAASVVAFVVVAVVGVSAVELDTSSGQTGQQTLGKCTGLLHSGGLQENS